MAYVLLSVALVLASATAAFCVTMTQKVIRGAERERARAEHERGELLNRIMYMAHQPWQVPDSEPVAQPWPEEENVYWPDLMPDSET